MKKTEPVRYSKKRRRKLNQYVTAKKWKKTEQPVFTANNAKLTNIEKKKGKR
jgi:hypothetical protein